MGFLANVKVGVRLAVAFGLVAVLLLVTVVIGVSSVSSQGRSSDTLAEANTLTRDALQVKFRSADFNGWQTAYAFDVFRGAPGAALDTGESRKAFLDSVASFRTALARSQRALSSEISSQFDQFMTLDQRIIADYRTGTPAAVASANQLVLADEITIFQKLASATDKLVGSVKHQSAAAAA